MIAAESYVGLMTNVPHILFELTWEGLTGLALYPVLRIGKAKLVNRVHHEIDDEHGVLHHDQPKR